VAGYSAPDALAPGAAAVIGATSSFFDESEWEPSVGSEFSDGDWRRGALLIERYDGEVRVVDGAEGPTIEFSFRLDPVAPPRSPPT
ncbi:MAG: hypothetical protein AAGF91_18250, partial [Actinomycetota bacterium]